MAFFDDSVYTDERNFQTVAKSDITNVAAPLKGTATPLLVFLSFTAQSTWIYGISTQEQQTIKTLIAGKTTAKALQLLAALPGIERVALQSSGFGDSSQIPKARSSIQLALFYG